jgi:hypothetical protein
MQTVVVEKSFAQGKHHYLLNILNMHSKRFRLLQMPKLPGDEYFGTTMLLRAWVRPVCFCRFNILKL